MARSKKSRAVRAAKPPRRSKAAAAQPAAEAAVQPPAVSNTWQLFGKAFRLIGAYPGYFVRFGLVCVGLNLLLVHNFSLDVATLKGQIETLLGTNALATGAGTFLAVLSAGSSATGAAGVYQYVLLIVISLALIWGLRQLTAATVRLPRVKDSFYRGMEPLVPFVLVLTVLGLCTLPFVIGASVYSLVSVNGIAVGVAEQLLWLMLSLGLAAISVWLLTRFATAAYIVTLPEVTPLQALRSSAKLTKGFRLHIFRKVVMLAIFLLLVTAILTIPAILVWTPLVQWVVFLCGVAALLFAHVYLYSLYRELLP